MLRIDEILKSVMARWIGQSMKEFRNERWTL